ncbi:hypothetical protein NTD80_12985 [Pseudomonas sp. 13B_2.1_Bac1]|uniref:hypothetical protein n=1 Tax=unclassified Pseudomonas TaxID=196821 RepID=UPI0013C46E11|nr:MULTISPECIES: hypothetical protein [unclassified Pseudomonas]MCU1783671.1 hypothetical protein [Pseudomonas sp. 13B_2.1_Bac1]QTV17087.1 hypothetical protein J9321_28955 [Pseudomonas fluorescens]
MLKPIRYSKWSPALAAGQKLMRTFALWLCQPTVKKVHVSKKSLVGLLSTPVEAEWLWQFLQREVGKVTLKVRAETIAGLDKAEKQLLTRWVTTTTDIGSHFSLNPGVPPLPLEIPLKNKADRHALQILMESFYSPGLRHGLPYGADGVATSDPSQHVNYERFKTDFLLLHKVDKDEDARAACVMCGAELRKAHIDHWVAKASYPMLSVCADNLVPMCDECNEAPNKGSEKVHTNGSFEEWFHPYKRHPGGKLVLQLNEPILGVRLASTDPADVGRVANLNKVLKLDTRWSKELRAEYRKVQRILERRQSKKQQPLTLIELYQVVVDWIDELSDAEPNHEVHQVLAEALQDPARLLAWHTEIEEDFKEDTGTGHQS